MRAVWWTCGCGARQCSRELGTPQCTECGKLARFSRNAPKDQAGFNFESSADESEVVDEWQTSKARTQSNP